MLTEFSPRSTRNHFLGLLCVVRDTPNCPNSERLASPPTAPCLILCWFFFALATPNCAWAPRHTRRPLTSVSAPAAAPLETLPPRTVLLANSQAFWKILPLPSPSTAVHARGMSAPRAVVSRYHTVLQPVCSCGQTVNSRRRMTTLPLVESSWQLAS